MISRLSRSLIKPVNSKYFSSQIKSVQGNRPPLNEENIPGRYAGVLFTISSQKESLNLVNADMEYLSQLINGSESFKSFLSNTAAKKSEHIAVLSEIYPGLNEITVKFLDTLIDNKRITNLPSIASTYLRYYKLLNKEESVTIVSAEKLNSSQEAQVSAALKETYTDTNFTIKYEINENILGGLQIYFGNSFLDCSLASRLGIVRGELEKLRA